MVENQELAIQTKETLETLLEAVLEMQNLLATNQMNEFYVLALDLKDALFTLRNIARTQKKEEVYVEVEKTITNCIVSLDRIIGYAHIDKIKATQKIEFELWILMRCLYIRFYFFSIIYPDEEKMRKWYQTEGKELCKNYYLEAARKTGEYKYDISIIITAYNKLEYTKMCVESVLSNLPKNLRCELILFNHGSSDGTKEYFESIAPDKQIDLEINGGGFRCTLFACEGKYCLGISNDVIMTPNSIDILYQAFEENKDMAFAVPMTSNISNLQVPIKLNKDDDILLNTYQEMEGLEKYAKKINGYNFNKEEIRFRLCDPLAFTRLEYYDLPGCGSLYSYLLTRGFEWMFPDDFMSMYFRRLGYKNVLMKDIYCHHFGSVTIKDEKLQQKHYSQGRKEFLAVNGIDPLGKGFCWTYNLFKSLICDKADSNRILGINCGLGSDILKIQQQIKEKTGNFKVKIINFTDRERYVVDLKGISDEVYMHKGWDDIIKHIKGKYDYILVGDKVEKSKSYQKIISELYECAKTLGTIIIFVPETKPEIQDWIVKRYENVVITEDCDIIYEIDDVITASMPRKGKYLFWTKSD